MDQEYIKLWISKLEKILDVTQKARAQVNSAEISENQKIELLSKLDNLVLQLNNTLGKLKKTLNQPSQIDWDQLAKDIAEYKG